MRDERPRFPATDATRNKLADAFRSALLTGDVDAFAHTLADDAVLYTDGGGKRLAALNPIYGKEKILRFFAGIASKQGLPAPDELQPVQINGMPGFVLRTAEGVETLAFEIAGEQVVAIYAIRNPDKLKHLA